jgi:hypothetical protein
MVKLKINLNFCNKTSSQSLYRKKSNIKYLETE